MKSHRNIQVINSLEGKPEYALIPFHVYKALRKEIEDRAAAVGEHEDYVPFDVADYVDNPVALARIKARMTQDQLARLHRLTSAS